MLSYELLDNNWAQLKERMVFDRKDTLELNLDHYSMEKFHQMKQNIMIFADNENLC